jgi:hypothetical protein
MRVFSREQYLSRRAAEVHKQMAELKQLRELVRLAEAARPLGTTAAADPSTVRAAIAPADPIAGSRSRTGRIRRLAG